MKKTLYVFLIGCILFLGILIGGPTGQTASDEIQEKIDDFEKEITDPDHDYMPDKKDNITPNLSNSLAKTGENVLDGIFKYAFSLIDGIVK
jgi:predicted PurR-regulated permease PerM